MAVLGCELLVAPNRLHLLIAFSEDGLDLGSLVRGKVELFGQKLGLALGVGCVVMMALGCCGLLLGCVGGLESESRAAG